jgi:methionyl-tRNA formyltransferase
MGDPVAGGSVYWLGEGVDAGPIAAQDFVFVGPGDTADSLWREKLFPLGLRLLESTLRDLDAGVIRRQRQDPAYATWEPSWGRAPLTRPDLLQLGALPEGMRVALDAGRA